MIQANRIYEFTTIPSFAVVIIFSLIKAVYIIKVTEKVRFTQIMSDMYGHKISKGEFFWVEITLKLEDRKICF